MGKKSGSSEVESINRKNELWPSIDSDGFRYAVQTDKVTNSSLQNFKKKRLKNELTRKIE